MRKILLFTAIMYNVYFVYTTPTALDFTLFLISCTYIIYVICSFVGDVIYKFSHDNDTGENTVISNNIDIEFSDNIIGSLNSNPIYEWVKIKGTDEKLFYDMRIQLSENAEDAIQQIDTFTAETTEKCFVVLPDGQVYTRKNKEYDGFIDEVHDLLSKENNK